MLSQKLWTKSFIMILTINFLLFLSLNMVAPALPIYFQNIGFSQTLTGIALSTYTLGSFLVRPIAGVALDRFGRRAIFFITTSLLIILCIAHTWSTSIVFLLLLRFLYGIDWGFASTTTSTIATDCIPRHMVGRGMGMFGVSISLAPAFAPVLAIELMNRYEFSGMIYVTTFVLIIALVHELFFPFNTQPHQKSTKIKNKPKEKDKILERTAILPAITIGLATLTMGPVTTYVPLYAITMGMENAGYFFTIFAIGIIIVRATIGPIMDRWGFVATSVPSFILMFVAMIILGMAQNLPQLLLSGFLYGMGNGGAQTTIQSLAVTNVSRERFGAANGTFFIGFDVGIGLGGLLGGLFTDLLGFSAMYLIMSIPILIAIFLMLKYRPKNISTTC